MPTKPHPTCHSVTPRSGKMVLSSNVKGSADLRASRRWVQPGGNLKGDDHPSTMDSSKKGAVGKGKDHTSTNGDIAMQLAKFGNHSLKDTAQSVCPLALNSCPAKNTGEWDGPADRIWCGDGALPVCQGGDSHRIIRDDDVSSGHQDIRPPGFDITEQDTRSSGWTTTHSFDHQDPSDFSSQPSLNGRTAAPTPRAPPGLDIPFVDWTDESVIDRWRGLKFGETTPPIQKSMASELLWMVGDPGDKHHHDIVTKDKQDWFLHNEWKQKYIVPYWKHENSAPIPFCCLCNKEAKRHHFYCDGHLRKIVSDPLTTLSKTQWCTPPEPKHSFRGNNQNYPSLPEQEEARIAQKGNNVGICDDVPTEAPAPPPDFESKIAAAVQVIQKELCETKRELEETKRELNKYGATQRELKEDVKGTNQQLRLRLRVVEDSCAKQCSRAFHKTDEIKGMQGDIEHRFREFREQFVELAKPKRMFIDQNVATNERYFHIEQEDLSYFHIEQEDPGVQDKMQEAKPTTQGPSAVTCFQCFHFFVGRAGVMIVLPFRRTKRHFLQPYHRLEQAAFLSTCIYSGLVRTRIMTKMKCFVLHMIKQQNTVIAVL